MDSNVQSIVTILFVLAFWGVVIYAGVKIWRNAAKTIAAEEVTIGVAAGPWSRFFARFFDLTFETSIIAVILAYYFDFAPDFDAATKNVALSNFLSNLIYTPPALFADAALMAIFGTTVGKAMFGIRVRTGDGTKLTLPGTLSRNFRMWLFGWGLGFPLVSIFTCLINYRKVAAGKRVSWDKSQHVNVTQAAYNTQIAMGIIISIALFAAVMASGIIIESLAKI